MSGSHLVLGLVALAAPALAQEHHQRPPESVFTVKPLGGGVHVLHGRGGNVGFLVGPDAVLVVDSQFKDLGPGIVAEIARVTDKPIRYLLNTHHHGDHVGGNAAFRPLALILAHDNVRKRMLAQPADVLRDNPGRIEEARKAGQAERVKQLEEQLAWAKTVKVEEIPAPVLTFDAELRIHVGAETAQIWHTPPAHTDGDSVVLFEKANVVHMGDLFFHQTVPVIDTRAGGSVKGYLAVLDAVLKRLPAGVTIIPGHGQVTDRAGLESFRRYLQDLLDLAVKARAAGQTKEEFVAKGELPRYKDFDGYAGRFKSNLAAAWDDAS